MRECCSCSVLFITQAADPLQRWGSADKHLQILERTGHWYCIEAPEQIGDAVVKFVDGLKVE